MLTSLSGSPNGVSITSAGVTFSSPARLSACLPPTTGRSKSVSVTFRLIVARFWSAWEP